MQEPDLEGNEPSYWSRYSVLCWMWWILVTPRIFLVSSVFEEMDYFEPEPCSSTGPSVETNHV
jgi:hypothetical protein